MSNVLVNGAGASAADPILKGLGIEWVIEASSMDAATFTDAWIDSATGIPGTNSIKASLSPAATVLLSGNAGSYSDTTKRVTLASTTGLNVSDWLYLNHASITAGPYQIATIPVAGAVTLVTNPFNGLGDKTGIAYQTCWRYDGTAGTAPITSSSGGSQNFYKAKVADSVGNAGQLEATNYVRDPPAGSAYISIGGVSYTGQTIASSTPSLAILAGWANVGGVAYVELANHSTQAVNNFQFGDSTTSEKTLAAAIASGLKTSAGDGQKYGRINLKSKSSGSILVGVDIDIIIDSLGPTVVFMLTGR